MHAGGLCYSFSMLSAMIAVVVSAYMYTQDERFTVLQPSTVWAAVVSLLLAWIISLLVFITCVAAPGYRSSFWSTLTCRETIITRFRTQTDVKDKFDVFTCHRSKCVLLTLNPHQALTPSFQVEEHRRGGQGFRQGGVGSSHEGQAGLVHGGSQGASSRRIHSRRGPRFQGVAEETRSRLHTGQQRIKLEDQQRSRFDLETTHFPYYRPLGALYPLGLTAPCPVGTISPPSSSTD